MGINIRFFWQLAKKKQTLSSYLTFSPLLRKAVYFLWHFLSAISITAFPLGSVLLYVDRTFLSSQKKSSDRTSLLLRKSSYFTRKNPNFFLISAKRSKDLKNLRNVFA